MKLKRDSGWGTMILRVLIIAIVSIIPLSLVTKVVGHAVTPYPMTDEVSSGATISYNPSDEVDGEVETDIIYARGFAGIVDRLPGDDQGGIAYLQDELSQSGNLDSYDSIAALPNWFADGDQLDAWFGWSVDTAGDVNGDGYDDLIIGAYLYDNDEVNTGQVYVYLGGVDGLDETPTWTVAGDQAEASFGRAVATAGDVNGDGYSDVIVGAPTYDNGETDEGRVYVYYGSSQGLKSTPEWIVESNQAGAELGRWLGPAGDVNNDGYSDVIIGAHLYDNGQENEGKAYVYYGSSAGLSATPDWTAEGDQANAEFGRAVNSAGDVNGDGYDDIIVGAPSYDNDQLDEGRAFVYLGSASGPSTTADWIAEDDFINAGFGWAVNTAGDINGDGLSDVIIGAPYYDNNQIGEGRTYVYLGSDAGLSDTPVWTIESNQINANLGWSVSSAGDVNYDGYSDILVGAPVYDRGETNEGTAFLYLGNACGMSNTATLVFEGDQPYAWLGIWVRAAGDVNKDGYDDMVVGAPLYDNGEEDEGAAFVFHGEPMGPNLPPRSDAGDDQVVYRNAITTLDGSGSSDPDCYYPLSYLWEQDGGPGVILNDPTIDSPNFISPPDPSVLTFTLTVTDTLGVVDPSPDEVVITVVNQPPLAEAGADQFLDTGEIVTLDGSGSSDPDGDYPLTYLWQQTQGPEVVLSDPTSVTPTFTAPSEPVALIFMLTVTDSLAMADPTPDEVRIMIGGALGYDIYLPVAMR